MSDHFAIGAAEPDDLPAAMALVFQHLPALERERRMRNALGLFHDGVLEGAGIFVLRGAAGVVGAIVCQLLPGRTGLVWPPQVAGVPGRDFGEDRLARAGIRWLVREGASVLQAMLTREEARLAAPLLRNGFVHATSLRYLRHFLDLSAAQSPADPRLALEPYHSCDQDAFHQTLLQSYEGSLDCPELNGRRELGDIIAGHKAHGRHDPSLWWLARLSGAPAAVLIATGMPEYTGYEVAYVGVIPEMRRKGLARELMQRALAEMRGREASQVAITVDGRNQPALGLYTGLGFEEFDRREVYLCL